MTGDIRIVFICILSGIRSGFDHKCCNHSRHKGCSLKKADNSCNGQCIFYKNKSPVSIIYQRMEGPVSNPCEPEVKTKST